jgi:hypothetical protein
VDRGVPEAASDQVVEIDARRKAVARDPGGPQVAPRVVLKVDPKAAENDVSPNHPKDAAQKSVPGVRQLLLLGLRATSPMISAPVCSKNRRPRHPTAEQNLGMSRVQLKIDVRVRNSRNPMRST